jgi:hypothetical protein
MSKLRERLTYANVMATIAVFIALGGASYAATQLPKNSVGTKQLKKNSVTTSKVKKEAITAAKVKQGTLTGTQINASTLGTVPIAETANTARVANTLAPLERWHEITDFDGCHVGPETDWENYGDLATAAYYRDPLGIVRLKGSLKCPGGPPGVAYTIFKLPEGFRPEAGQYFLAPAGFGSKINSLAVSPNGHVSFGGPAGESGSHLSLDMVNFRCGPSGQDGCP